MEPYLGAPLDKLPEVPVNDLELDDLVKELLNDPDKLGSSDLELSDEKLLDLYRYISQYSRMACENPDKSPIKKVAFASVSNIRETYLRRQITTGTVGFLYQMLYEYSVDENKRSWYPSAPKENDPFDLDKLVEKASRIHEMALQAKKSQIDYENLVAQNLRARETREELAKKAELTDDDKAQLAELDKFGSQEKMDEEERYHIMSSQYCRYSATYLLHLYGKEAQERIVKTRQEAFKYEEVKKKAEDSKMRYVEPPGKLTMPEGKAIDIVRDFLNQWFKFDPSVHVRSGASNGVKTIGNAVKADLEKCYAEPYYADELKDGVDTLDPTHFTLEQINSTRFKPKSTDKAFLANINLLTSDKQFYNTAVNICQNLKLHPVIYDVLSNSDKYLKHLIPNVEKLLTMNKRVQNADLPSRTIVPQDTFHRLSYYMEVNFSCIRAITEAIYPERADLDLMIALWDFHEGTDDENSAAFKAHCRKYQSQMPSNIVMVPFGKWAVLTDHEKNRDKIDIYNKDTMVLERILTRHENDKKLGAELMKNRIRNVKAKNIREDGPDAQGLKGYSQQNKSMPTTLQTEEKLRLEATNGNVKAAEELKHLDELRAIVKSAEEKINLGQQLLPHEQDEYQSALNAIPRAEEMLVVPDNAIQVDVFTNKDGQMVKSSFYTRED